MEAVSIRRLRDLRSPLTANFDHRPLETIQPNMQVPLKGSSFGSLSEKELEVKDFMKQSEGLGRGVFQLAGKFDAEPRSSDLMFFGVLVRLSRGWF